ncbi:hypothetical protein CWI82_08235 [Pseudidiomarina tainanensis]|jgi:hypothetical protein|uniref:Uncharacterized protein n=2 Tax=Pseudidiomarina TaxID=2800384 RepID=A0A1I6G2T9_9GAMM|nr:MULTISPECIES: hypothetical protein [Pseudidiomarina]RZQ57240.1 hypothetical protein CWI82_08235 [Pseudidiomarina tainanensis]SFR36525.1 hypothetical protein SAMN04488070_0074 [Pseudidiomarina maritima]
MKTTITSIVVASALLFGSAQAQEQEQQTDSNLESYLTQSISQEVSNTRKQVKTENQLELMQYFAEVKLALNPSRMLNNVAEVAVELISGNEE